MLAVIIFCGLSVLLVSGKALRASCSIFQKLYLPSSVIGGLLGLVPQCGFSAVVASLFAARIVTPGTVLAVFLATSDEMLPVFLGAGLPVGDSLAVMGIKLLVAVVFGFATDLIFCRGEMHHHVSHFCDEEHCHCEQHGRGAP